MLLPAAAETSPSFDLRPLLTRWAARYMPDDFLRKQLVEVTIATAVDDPDLLNGNSVEKALFFMLHKAALKKLGLSPPETKGRSMSHANLFTCEVWG
ncbi:hypothetical protein [Neorhizobium sp. NCHU2750]|uniref:hypothetical protein n=1 Tax=Neorhizobium sp. NCHU2750 TaxID=1825976 RepID=UPI000E715EC5|nr:hypothetical protein NCHU2750_57380 [Neorhizobium sp. NCHU2750]